MSDTINGTAANLLRQGAVEHGPWTYTGWDNLLQENGYEKTTDIPEDEYDDFQRLSEDEVAASRFNEEYDPEPWS